MSRSTPPEPSARVPRGGGGFFDWLGRQVGFVVGAARSRRQADAGDSGADDAPPVDSRDGPRTIWRRRSVAEQPMPGREDVTLRRTTVDEVIRARRPERDAR